VGFEPVMEINPNAIASRTLLLRIDGQEEKVTVEIGPLQKNETDASCHVRIAGSESELHHDIYGIDAIQALQLALKIVGSELNRVADEQAYLIEGTNEPGHGFEDMLNSSQGRN
jgi:hypothetical protein